jgi:hypothetical protein
VFSDHGDPAAGRMEAELQCSMRRSQSRKFAMAGGPFRHLPEIGIWGVDYAIAILKEGGRLEWGSRKCLSVVKAFVGKGKGQNTLSYDESILSCNFFFPHKEAQPQG